MYSLHLRLNSLFICWEFMNLLSVNLKSKEKAYKKIFLILLELLQHL